MKIVENLQEKATTIILDDTSFINCNFDECVIVYHGGDVSFVNTHWNNCQLAFAGPASKTAAILQIFGWRPPDKAVMPPPQAVVN